MSAPPRVPASERALTSLVCRCGHLLADHDADAWDADGMPVNRQCRIYPCDCGWDKT
ncbi:MAG: hypothetical protein M3N43_03035 [Actinomycetota bacterium]|nr:hypothetical protein [Actinomycetota bacterium]